MMRELQHELPEQGRTIYKNTPLNEDQLLMEGIDLNLTFLQSYVDQQRANGMPDYNP